MVVWGGGLWKLKRKSESKDEADAGGRGKGGEGLQKGARVRRSQHSDHHIYAGSRRERCLLCGRTQCAGRRNLDTTSKTSI